MATSDRDNDPDSDRDIRWMSYGEAAEALGIHPESVAKRSRRNGWPKQEGNDGKPRVGIPSKLLLLPDMIRGKSLLSGRDNPANTSLSVPVSDRDMKAPETGVPVSVPDTSWLVPALATHLQLAMERADGAEAKLLDAVRQAAAAEGEAAALRRQIEADRERVAADLARLEAEREAAREELAAWTAGGPLTRALRGFFRRRGV
jgi:hypothetical protein